MPPPEPSDPKKTTSQFEKLLAALAARKVDFAVAGGLAVILNGYPRVTDDVDIIVNHAPENISKMLECLRGWGEGYAREFKPEEFVLQEGALRLMEQDFDLDIFTLMRGKSLDDFRPRLRYLDSGSLRIPYLSPEDLISLKQGSWREKDQLDVAALKEIIAREQGKA